MQHTFVEFFAGGGMARLGLGDGWRCLLANDIDQAKARVYRANFGHEAHLLVDDISNIGAGAIVGEPDLVWGSFPCQDLSLAGLGKGLHGQRSGMFWQYLRIVRELRDEGRSPAILALENVIGTLTSRQGHDFKQIVHELANLGYVVGALVIDAVLFVPQSRPRLFIIAVRGDLPVPHNLRLAEPDTLWHSTRLVANYEDLDGPAKERWVWWGVPHPARRLLQLDDIVESGLDEPDWNSQQQTDRLLGLMSEVHRSKIHDAQAHARLTYGTLYRRTRKNATGEKVQRAEIRLDGIAGCLRTPSGGSSRQTIVEVDGSRIRSRLLTARETARLMGLPDTYQLPDDYNAAYHVTGDGVVVPVVRHLAASIFEPVLDRIPRASVKVGPDAPEIFALDFARR